LLFNSIQLTSAIAANVPAYVKPEIYRQIGTPNGVLECRASRLIKICELDALVVRDDDGNLNKLVLLMPDMSAGLGCPRYGCPFSLTKQ
jgi:hypothetical protein